MKKTVLRRDLNNDTTKLLATFELDGGEVKATYSDQEFQSLCEDLGILSPRGEVRPADGKIFWDSLSPYFARSTLIEVTNS